MGIFGGFPPTRDPYIGCPQLHHHSRLPTRILQTPSHGPTTIPDLDLQAVATNTFMAMPSSLLGLFIVFGIAAYFFWDTVKMVWAQRKVPILVGTGAILLLMHGIDTPRLRCFGWTCH